MYKYKLINLAQAPNKLALAGGKSVKNILESEEYKGFLRIEISLNWIDLVDNITHEFKIALQQARQAKKLTQDQLAKVYSFSLILLK